MREVGSDFRDKCYEKLQYLHDQEATLLGDIMSFNQSVVHRVMRIIFDSAHLLDSIFSRGDRTIFSESVPDTSRHELCVVCLEPVCAEKGRIWVVPHEPGPQDLPHQCCNLCVTADFNRATEDAPARCEWDGCDELLVQEAEPESQDNDESSKNTRAKHLLSEWADKHRIVKLRVDKSTSIFRQRRLHQPQALANFKDLPRASADDLLTAASQEPGEIGEYLEHFTNNDT